MVEFSRGFDQSVTKGRLRLLQRQVVRRPSGVEHFQPAGQIEQHTEQPLHSDQSDAVCGARGKRIVSGRRKRRR